MKSNTVWQIRVFTLVLLTHSSQANMGCPIDSTRHSNRSLIHMCRDETINGISGLFLDGFVSANENKTCNCSIWASELISVGISEVQIPEKNCPSSLTINELTANVRLVYTCRGEDKTARYTHNIDEKGYFIQLESTFSRNNATYCIDIVISGGSGYLNIKCPSPYHDLTTHSTVSSTLSSETKTTGKAATMQPLLDNESEDFPVAAVAGGVGGVVLISVIIIFTVGFAKRRRRSKHGGNDSDTNDGGYCNMDADPYKYQNTKSSGNHPGVSADQNQTGNQTIPSPSDDYASIDDEAGGVTRKPQVALKPNLPNTNDYSDVQPQPDHDDVSDMYAKVNKNKKPAKSVNEAAMPVMHVNELYAVVDKTKKGKQPLKAKPSGDVYAVVKKLKKSGEKSPESKGQDSESEITGDVYTEVRKPKKSGNNPNIPKGSPGLMYTEVEFDENTDEPQGATGSHRRG